MKIFFRRIHLYMGLATGLVIMITCLTGAILVYEKELQQLFNHDRYFTTAQPQRLSLDSIEAVVKTNIPKGKIASLKLYADPERNVEVSYTLKTSKKKDAKPERLVAFVDPYSGSIAEVYNHRESFFYWVMDVHRWMLAGDTGKVIVGICTIVFLFILITGIILWWPKNKAILKQRLTFKKGASFKRLNHDYHVVFGFYTAIFLFIFAFTGLAWSFEWFNDSIYSITGTTKERAKAPESLPGTNGKASPETALQAVFTQASPYYTVALPKDSLDAFAVTILPESAAHESATDTYYIDRFTGKSLGVHKFTDRNKGQRIRATFKPVHIASIYGQFSKIIGFVVCLLGTFFPISGFIMWMNRTWGKKKGQSRD